jgi:1-acyl-sn-glycerol-3-phosphate acyltransferase
MKDTLSEEKSLCVVPGGVAESFHNANKEFRLVLKSRKGIFRIAIDTRTPLVPILTFGENELFLPLDSPLYRRVQNAIESYTSIQFPIPRWSCIKRWFTLLRKPFDEPVKTYIGEPVYPEKGDTVESLRERYISALDALYDTHRPEGWAEKIEYE